MGKNYYKSLAFPGAHASPPFQQKILTDLLEWITGQKAIKTALDLGSGLGYNLPTLSPFCSQIWATDISQPVLKESQKNHPALKNIHYLTCDASKLLLPDKKFDLVVSTEVLEHVKNPQKVITECYQVLKPGGFLIVSTPNYQNLTGVIKWWRDKRAGREWWDPWGAHAGGLERKMTPGVLQKLVSRQFKILKTRGANYLLAWLYFLPQTKYYDYFPFLTLGKFPFIKNFGMQYYVLAQKK